MKDIFIDTNIAKNFTNPLDPIYKKLLRWLTTDVQSHWVVNQKLLVEYGRTNQTILVLIDQLQRQGRLIKKEKAELNAVPFPKQYERKLHSNSEDWVHLKTIWLSHRKIGIIIDEGLRHDVNQSPKQGGIQPKAFSRPEEINYETYDPY
jgi:hypothetical protein